IGRHNGLIFLSLWFLLFLGTSGSAVYPGEIQVPVHFDFGPANGRVKVGFISVNENTAYSKIRGYGLISESGRSSVIEVEDLEFPEALIFDGVASSEPIIFRVDVPAGEYIIELFMAGGKLSQWRGEIRANDVLIADTINQYGVSFEGEEPPVYWSLLRKINSSDDSITLSISAKDQDTNVAGISIYKNDFGPIFLKSGKLSAVRELQAPNAKLALALINKGAASDAHRIIDPIPESKYGFEKAMLLLALAGRLEIADARVQVDLAAKILKQDAAVNQQPEVVLNLRLAELYLEGDTFYKMAGWDWAKEMTGVGIFGRLNLACHDFLKISQIENHPLYHRAIWNLGRAAFWAWVEQHDAWQKERADEYFQILKPFYPDHRLLRIYSGDQLLPQNIDTTFVDEKAPQWAKKANLALNSVKGVIKYWVDNRQAENGEFGGKYDDDVEMLRWWPISRLASNNETALLGLRRLVDGVWNSGWITNGFSTKVRDVEHSSEPVADTQPMMIGLDYGNPIYVERCMESIKGLRDVWTGVNSYGHRHFKSSWYSYNTIDAEPPKDCDVEMNTRTVKAARWLAWYNRHPFAMQFIKEWTDAWLEDCYRTDKGKPYGVVPSAIRYEDDAIGGHADNWHHPGMFWSYYNFHGGTRMLQQFLATYLLTGDARYLQPIELALKLVVKYEGEKVQDAPIGSEAWVAGILRKSGNFAEIIEKWRLLTGNPEFDDIVLDVGSDYLKFRLTDDQKYLVTGCDRIIEGILYNRELITTEGYFTDRIEIGNVNKSEVWGASHLEAMFTGSALNEGFYPFYSVTWHGLGDNFAATVLKSDSHQVRILAYNLTDSVKVGNVAFWMLTPGVYSYVQGADKDQNGKIDKITFKDEFEVRTRSTVHAVKLPQHELQIIEVAHKHNGVTQTELADLAITDSEIHLIRKGSDIEIVLPVHNIGIAIAENVRVEVREGNDAAQKILAEIVIKEITAPLDLNPREVPVSFKLSLSDLNLDNLTIVIDPENEIPEITESNNQIVVEGIGKR
ncbi:MAG: CARDB domain-containing protein, partial [bacterium]